MHGGAHGSGAPKGNQNALKHGGYTKHAFQRRAEMRELLREASKLLKELSSAETRMRDQVIGRNICDTRGTPEP